MSGTATTSRSVSTASPDPGAGESSNRCRAIMAARSSVNARRAMVARGRSARRCRAECLATLAGPEHALTTP